MEAAHNYIRRKEGEFFASVISFGLSACPSAVYISLRISIQSMTSSVHSHSFDGKPGAGSPSKKQSAEALRYHTETASAENDGESFDAVPKANRRIGTLSATMLIANRMIGTGIFATPGLYPTYI